MKVQAHEILSMYFERKRLTFPSYSMRALARDVGVSPAYVSTILSGKKPLPVARIKDFIKVLELDDVAALQLKNALYPFRAEETSNNISLDAFDFLNNYKPLDKKKYEVLNDWYNVAIMDLTTCYDFVSDPAWIARKLKINQLQVEISIESLKQLGLLSFEDGKLQKVESKMRMPTKSSLSVIRKFHKQMIKKAYEELDSNESDEDFKKRLITGSTFALNSEHLDLLKEKLQQALYEVSSLATKGSCESVYQLNIQFFPLTK